MESKTDKTPVALDQNKKITHKYYKKSLQNLYI